MKLTEAQAWACVANSLEMLVLGSPTAPAYDPFPQYSLCACASSLKRCSAITHRTWAKMCMRLQLFAPHSDSSARALFWNRHYKAAREQRVLAAHFLYHMARNKEPL